MLLYLLAQFGMTALMWAARIGHAAVVDLLVDRGTNLNLQDYVSKQNTKSYSSFFSLLNYFCRLERLL